VTFAESLIVPDLPSTVVLWRVVAVVVMADGALVTSRHSEATPEPVVLSVEPV
jgi:hypothetical protein